MTASRALAALALSITLLAPVASTATPVAGPGESARTSEDRTTTTITLQPTRIGLSAPEIPNPMRGQYQWLGQATQPAHWPGADLYFRDQVVWSRLEPTRGTYDFSWIDQGLADAEANGGLFGFRVMAYCPGCWIKATPDWMPTQGGKPAAGGDRHPPKWNAPEFRTAWKQLITELSRRYGNDPRLGWVDVGGYGNWGEWHVSSGEKITKGNALQMIATVVKAFPRQHVVVNTMNEYVPIAVRRHRSLGLRTDCLGEFNMFSTIPTSPELQDVWKRAPVLSEWCSTPSTSVMAGAQQVRQYHVSQVSSGNLDWPYVDLSAANKAAFTNASKAAGYRYSLKELRLPSLLTPGTVIQLRTTWRNDGSAPTYDDWRQELILTNTAGAELGTATMFLPGSLRKVLPGELGFKAKRSVPTLPPGTYSVSLRITHPRGYLAPMNLAITGRQADGSYLLGQVTVQ